jgi:hypothetical protein
MIQPEDHLDAEVIARKATVRNYVAKEVDNDNAYRVRVNKALVALGIEPLPGPSDYTFEYEVAPGVVAVYRTQRNTEAEAREAIEAIRQSEGVNIPEHRLKFRTPNNLGAAVLVSAVPV